MKVEHHLKFILILTKSKIISDITKKKKNYVKAPSLRRRQINISYDTLFCNFYLENWI